MSEKVKCAATKYSRMWAAQRPFCKNAGTLEHDGQVWCKLHHPPTEEERRAKRHKALTEAWERQKEESEARQAEAAAQAADAARFRWLVDGPEDIEAMVRRLLQDGEHRGDIRAAFDRVMAREGGDK
jgi:hypothetical protein